MFGRVLMGAALLYGSTGTALAKGPVFSCKLPGGKTVTVTGEGERFTYRYGTAKKAELVIVGTVAGRNITKRSALHGGGSLDDLRFVKGAYSYVVYGVPRNDIRDSDAVSGLTVFRGGNIVMERKCAPFAELTADLSEIPETPNGSPSFWGDLID